MIETAKLKGVDSQAWITNILGKVGFWRKCRSSEFSSIATISTQDRAKLGHADGALLPS
ncbi:MAG: hypothetical protein VCD66_19555 [Alphaproteobacteria bacterium]